MQLHEPGLLTIIMNATVSPLRTSSARNRFFIDGYQFQPTKLTFHSVIPNIVFIITDILQVILNILIAILNILHVILNEVKNLLCKFAPVNDLTMELFYSRDIEGGICRLDQDESGHCIKVLRHRAGDEISVIDGCGTLCRCRITVDSPKGVEAMVLSSEEGWGGHPYRLHMAVCPTKNNDRYEWFAEKACEIGLDEISPVIGEHSERRVFKTARLEKILVSAAKQSLKGAVPAVNEPVSVKEFIQAGQDCGSLKLIAYCFEDENVPRRSIKEVLAGYEGEEIVILIGPEGDFSRTEAELALSNGFIPVHLGASRLRTETAALTAVSAVYFQHM